MSPSLDDLDWPVRTARLTIRRATPEDAAAMWPYRSLPEVADWLVALPTDPASFERRLTSDEVLPLTLVIEHEGHVIGDLRVEVTDGWSQAEVEDQASRTEAEVGWVLAPAHHGQGFGTEAAEALLELCFDGLGVRRVYAGCFTDNVPSWRLMERVGMRRETHSLRDGLHRTRGWLDGYTYALLAEEWAARAW